MAVRDRCDASRSVRELTVETGGQFVLLVVLWAGAGLGPVGWVAGIAYGLAVWASLTIALDRERIRSFGPANRVTLARATLVGGVTALVADSVERPAPVTVLVVLATVALVLDAVDGQIARRTGTATPLGARFDMEVDAFLILVLSVFVAGLLGWWVLAIGAMRYAFVVAARVLPWLRPPLPPSLARKTVAAVQGIVLVVACAPIVPRPLAVASVGLALILLGWSFGRDVRWLWRVREHRPTLV